MLIQNPQQLFSSHILLYIPTSPFVSLCISGFLPLYSFSFSPWLPTQASSFTFQPSILLNSSSMQHRSTPSFAPPSSCYLIPHNKIAIPPCIACITSINLFPKRIKSAALTKEGDGWTNSKVLISDSGIHTKCTITEICSVTPCSVTRYLVRQIISFGGAVM